VIGGNSNTFSIHCVCKFVALLIAILVESFLVDQYSQGSTGQSTRYLELFSTTAETVINFILSTSAYNRSKYSLLMKILLSTLLCDLPFCGHFSFSPLRPRPFFVSLTFATLGGYSTSILTGTMRTSAKRMREREQISRKSSSWGVGPMCKKQQTCEDFAFVTVRQAPSAGTQR
jgi:hypothetical protein